MNFRMTPGLGFVLFQYYTWQLEFIVFKYSFNINIWIAFIGKIWKESKKLDCVCLTLREVWEKVGSAHVFLVNFTWNLQSGSRFIFQPPASYLPPTSGFCDYLNSSCML